MFVQGMLPSMAHWTRMPIGDFRMEKIFFGDIATEMASALFVHPISPN